MNQDKLIINFVPTGMIPTKEMNSNVPTSVSEIVEETHKAVELGITMIHLHSREEKSGIPTYRKEIYAKLIEGIRRFSKDLIICVSLSGRNFNEFEQRSDVLQLSGNLKPDMGSLTLGSLNFTQTASVNEPSMVKHLAKEMKNKGILPELEAFDLGMINYAKFLEKKGLLKPPHYFNLLMGNIAGAQGKLLHAGMMVQDLPDQSYWSFAGIGDIQLQMNSLAVAFGGGVRVGLEDHIWYDKKRSKLASNMELLNRIHHLAKIHERDIMSSSQMRENLNLAKGHGQYGRN